MAVPAWTQKSAPWLKSNPYHLQVGLLWAFTPVIAKLQTAAAAPIIFAVLIELIVSFRRRDPFPGDVTALPPDSSTGEASRTARISIRFLDHLTAAHVEDGKLKPSAFWAFSVGMLQVSSPMRIIIGQQRPARP